MKQAIGFFDKYISKDRTIDLLVTRFKPDLETVKDKIEDASWFPDECSRCGEMKTACLMYKFSEQEEYIRVSNQKSLCPDCETNDLSKEVQLAYDNLEKNHLRHSWYHVDPNLATRFDQYETYNKCTITALKTSMTYVKKILAGEKKSLLLMGNPGTGKTFLAQAIAKELDEKGLMVGYISAVDLFKKIKATFDGRGTEERLFKEMRALDVLIIDDVGVETVKRNQEVSWTITKWTEIVENRLNLANVYTTNMNDTNIHEAVGERATSRLYENTLFIDLFTDDYRKTRKKLTAL